MEQTNIKHFTHRSEGNQIRKITIHDCDVSRRIKSIAEINFDSDVSKGIIRVLLERRVEQVVDQLGFPRFSFVGHFQRKGDDADVLGKHEIDIRVDFVYRTFVLAETVIGEGHRRVGEKELGYFATDLESGVVVQKVHDQFLAPEVGVEVDALVAGKFLGNAVQCVFLTQKFERKHH